jgi:hypothetical protein
MSRAYHLGDRAALAQVSVPALPAGVVAGRDQRRNPVVLRLFRSEPTLSVLVGRWWAARLLVFRALGVGARVVVRTAWPDQWNGLGDEATNRPDRLAIIPVGSVAAVPARMDEPALHVVDLGTDAGPQRSHLGPWQAQLTLLPGLVPAGLPVLAEAGLTVFQRLSPAEAGLAAGALGLIGDVPGHLTMTPDDGLIMYGGGEVRYATVVLTEVERQLLGVPTAG